MVGRCYHLENHYHLQFQPLNPNMSKPIANVPARINSLYDQGLVILSREMKHLAKLNVVHKLEAGPARDLRDYIKLLADMKEASLQRQAEVEAKAEAARKAKSTEELEQALAGAGGGSPQGPFRPIGAPPKDKP